MSDADDDWSPDLATECDNCHCLFQDIGDSWIQFYGRFCPECYAAYWSFRDGDLKELRTSGRAGNVCPPWSDWQAGGVEQVSAFKRRAGEG